MNGWQMLISGHVWDITGFHSFISCPYHWVLPSTRFSLIFQELTGITLWQQQGLSPKSQVCNASNLVTLVYKQMITAAHLLEMWGTLHRYWPSRGANKMNLVCPFRSTPLWFWTPPTPTRPQKELSVDKLGFQLIEESGFYCYCNKIFSLVD